MQNRTVLSILRYLQDLKVERLISELHLTRFFTTVQLDDGSVGACMAYYRFPDSVLVPLEERLQRECLDPFMVQNVEHLEAVIADHVSEEQQRNWILASLLSTVASALSAQIIRNGGDEWFTVANRRPAEWIRGAETALVVGFGGFLEPLLGEDKIKKVHTLDLLCERKGSGFRVMVETKLAALASQYPTKSITVSSRLENPADLKNFDFISVTGSTLCNDSLDYFLNNARQDAVLVLQGQSASMHPKVLFDAGVKWIATTLKPEAIGRMGRDHDGTEMRPLLEGGLPWIYLLPQENGSCAQNS